MEYKKVETFSTTEETRSGKDSDLLKENTEKCPISDIRASRELRINIEEFNLKNEKIKLNLSNVSAPNELIKESNFEHEDEWDIGGIPELLNELDADIENSLKSVTNSKFDGTKNEIKDKKGKLKTEQPTNYHQGIIPKHLNSFKHANEINFEGNISKSLNLTTLSCSTSTFAGFSKGGHLISSPYNALPHHSTTINNNCSEIFKSTKSLDKKIFTFSMSSQGGNNNNSSSNISGTGISNISSGQTIPCSNNSSKLNTKMSIDHQATLDKGLKMKIKRTKPGTKSSEAKHEIVKATEQQQNGLPSSGTSACPANQEDETSASSLPNQSTSSSSQNSNVTLGITNFQGNTNKKNLGSVNNQNNISLNNSGNISLNNNVCQTPVLATKRGSSGHRRDKARDKSSHSKQIDKNSLMGSDKESIERPTCHCINNDISISTCSNSSCTRKTENNSLTQRLPVQNTGSNSSAIPPGIFTPSTDGTNTTTISSLIAVTTSISTPVSTQTISNSVNANAPGPPNKEISANNGGNIKISSHIAAQLAAAASNNTTNGSCVIASSFPNTDLKSASTNVQNQIIKQVPPATISATTHHTLSVSNNKTSNPLNMASETSTSTCSKLDSPPAKRVKHIESNVSALTFQKEKVDVCIGTSVGTITEPDCLGPCEPGTSVTLEGIVWHETEGGVLVVNVTWRGKTYVGTLLDCTRHDWAPPRFCDSPTDDMDARTPKGRGKRGRTTITPDLSNFTETRSSIYFSHSHVHSKLRNGSAKSGRGNSRTISVPPVDKTISSSSLSSGNCGSTPSTSPTAFLPPRPEKRKSKDESPPPVIGDNDTVNSGMVNASGIPISSNSAGNLTNQPQSLVNPVTGLNVQISTKKCKTSSPSAISPVLLECPEQDCSKKYKHANGLRYHQSHAHGTSALQDEDSMVETEEHITSQLSPLSITPTSSMTTNTSDLLSNTQSAASSESEITKTSEISNSKKLDQEESPPQINITEKSSISETDGSLPCENLLTSAETNTDGKPNLEQPNQLLELVGNNKMNKSTEISLEITNISTHQNLPGKSGVLRFGQGDAELLPTNTPNEALRQTESLETTNDSSISPEKFTSGSQDSNNDKYSGESLEKATPLKESNVSTAALTLSKARKGRKSPSSNDYDALEINTCNIPSREDVQSPAYSDISDDSTPVNENDHIDKVNISKNSDINKKSQDILSPVSTCHSNQSNISSTLGNYGVYQFYQEQQFIASSHAEQNAKNALNSNIGTAIVSPSLNQQPNISEFNGKKDPPLDLISKANSNQNCPEISKDPTRSICVTDSPGNSDLSNVPPIGPGALSSPVASKSVSHFYAFNYMPPNYPYNVDPNYGPVTSITTTEDNAKPNRIGRMSSPNDQTQQQLTTVLYKEDRSKEDMSSTDNVKSSNPQISSKQAIKADLLIKSECIKQEVSSTQHSQHMQIQNKDNQGIGVYTNMFQRHPLPLPSQQLSREEELRRYYIFSDQHRRQNSSSQNTNNQQVQNTSPQSGNHQCKDDTSSQQQHIIQNQQQIKIKSSTSLSVNKSLNSITTSKESPKQKQDEDLKIIKQEGQKPTMETQGPPPPPTSQYFLHPSYITSTPFGFDPSHPMYRNVLMPASSPYNTPSYHLPLPRYHAPEDLSRNTGTKALDALHHAASQYYNTHKIHELSERALKSPNSSNSNNMSNTIKISGSSPNIGTAQHSNIGSNSIGHLAIPNHSAQLTHNLAPQNIGISNKQDITSQKSHGNGTQVPGASLHEQQKPQTSLNSSASSNCSSGNISSIANNNISSGNTSDSRSPPPQRHVHTHHHTHVGLGYPMYPAPYGAAVLASQQAAAVAVINPFPPAPNK